MNMKTSSKFLSCLFAILWIASTSAVVAAAEKSFDWKRFSGSTVNVLLVAHPYSDLLKPIIPEFEKLTGIKVRLEILAQEQARQKHTIGFSTGLSDIDVFAGQPFQEGLKYYTAGWYELLDKYVRDKELVSPDFDYDDIPPAAIDQNTVMGHITGIPMSAGPEVLIYRKDLFTAAGLKPPQTFQELEAAGKKFTDKTKGEYGLCLRGKGAATTTIFAGFLHGMGGSWADKNLNPALNRPAALTAFEYYGRLAREYAPPGVTNYEWFQCQNLLAVGKAAMWIDGSDHVAPLYDAKQSQVADKIGVSMFPEGPAGRKPAGGSWYYSIYSKSKNKGPGWYFIQWALGKEISLRALLRGLPPARISPWESEAFRKQDKHPDLTKTIIETMKLKDTPSYGPPWTAVGEIRDLIGAVVVTAIEGGDIKAAADKLQTQIQAVREKSGEKIVK